MIDEFLRKLRQVATGPELRKWIAGRLLGQFPPEPAYLSHRPPYLEAMLPLKSEVVDCKLSEISEAGAPKRPIDLKLAGQKITLQPGQESELFQRTFEDPETRLSLHRFAWVPLMGTGSDPAWVNVIWSAWNSAYGIADQSLAWHPYTAAERAINILEFAGRHGFPSPREDTVRLLAAHGPAIARNLEYYGEHHTSNHLANNGRGLFALGLVLNLPDCTQLGATILIEEAKRIFLRSGMLREGSSHYHLLLTHNYGIALKMAQEYGHPACGELSAIVRRIHSPLPYLKLPGGFPWIGDMSPDLPPALLIDELFNEVDFDVEPCDPSILASDGWLRIDCGPWSALCHAAPGGWSHMPGHGHQDCGSFELHYNDTPVFIDPGRGKYGELGEAALYRSASVHNSLAVDGCDPYPPNKPYFNDDFRLKIGGPPPRLTPTADGFALTFSGYSRLKSVGLVGRVCSFDGEIMTLSERVEGSGVRTITHTFCTALAAELNGNSLRLTGNGMTFVLKFDRAQNNIELEKATRWTAYGEGQPATFIRLTTKSELPWLGSITLQKI